MTIEPGEQKKIAWRERTAMWRHRVLWWLHHYLALDVLPPPDETDVSEVPPVMEESRPTPRPRVAAPPPPERGVLRRVVLATGAVPRFAKGDCIADTYDVVEVLKAGDLSTAYRGHHRQWDIDLIIKVPSADVTSTPSLLREWVASVERWAGLGVHPHIASCYSVQWIGDIPLAVTEYVGDQSLRAPMKQGRYADLQPALNVAMAICHGLEHAHARGVVHGGLTPDSVRLTAHGMPKVSDFDAAVATGAPAQLATAPATAVPGRRPQCAPAYVAPERWGPGYTAQPAADLFSLGVCLYEIFFGRPPFGNTSGAAQPLPSLQLLGNGEPPPEALLGLLRRCLEWTPYRRPPGVEQVRAELSALYATFFGTPDAVAADPAQQAAEWNTKAVSYYHMGNETDADAAWAAALEVDPTCLEAAFNRDVASWRRGQCTDESVLQGIDAMPVAPADRGKAGHLAALVHQERGDLDAALVSLERAQGDQPDATEVQAALARVQMRCQHAALPPAVVGQHDEFVSAVALSADGQIAVSASDDTTAVLWDVASGNHVRVLEGHSAPLSCVHFDAAHATVLTGSVDGTLRLWDSVSGACRLVIETHHGRISSAAVSPDGRLIVCAGIQSSEHVEQMTLQLWDAHTGRLLRPFTGLTSAIKSLCFSADGDWVVTGGDDQTVRVWDVETSACQLVFAGHGHYVSAVCMSADGRFILSGSWDRTVRLWDTQSGELLRTFEGHTALVTSVCVNADAQWALSGSWDSTVRLWAVASGRCVRTFRGHRGLVTGVALSADASRGISGSWDRSVRFWDTAAERREPCQLRLAAGTVS